MAQYKTGTVSVTTGDQTVTGTNTLWVANVNPGDGFTVAGTGVPYTVASVTNDTSLELSTPYAGATASGQSYAIYRDFTTNNSYPELSQGDIETATIWTRALRLIDGDVGAIEADYYNTGNILGTVSQSAGVPTGAIIERGSNANGEYVKFADGTLEMLQRVDIDLSTNANQYLPSFPVTPFNVSSVGRPSITVSGASFVPSEVAALSSISALTGNSNGIIQVNSPASSTSYPVVVTMKARWF